LDSEDRDGNEVLSEEDEEYDDEEDEGEEIDEETLNKLRAEAAARGDLDDYDDEEEYGDEEEGEDDYGDEDDEDDDDDDLGAGTKRGPSNGNDGAASKRKKWIII